MHAEKNEQFGADAADDSGDAPDLAPIEIPAPGRSADAPDDSGNASEFDPIEIPVLGRSIAEVLFPANPPTPVNARLVKRFGLEDERKPRGLASAAGWYPSRPAEPGSK